MGRGTDVSLGPFEILTAVYLRSLKAWLNSVIQLAAGFCVSPPDISFTRIKFRISFFERASFFPLAREISSSRERMVMSVQGVDVERAGENDNGCCSKQELKQDVSS